jgi:hypothetical protein
MRDRTVTDIWWGTGAAGASVFETFSLMADRAEEMGLDGLAAAWRDVAGWKKEGVK